VLPSDGCCNHYWEYWLCHGAEGANHEADATGTIVHVNYKEAAEEQFNSLDMRAKQQKQRRQEYMCTVCTFFLTQNYHGTGGTKSKIFYSRVTSLEVYEEIIYLLY